MLNRSTLFGIAAFLYAASFVVAAQKPPTATSSTQSTANPPGWTLPPNAADEQNPLKGDPKAVLTGKQLFGKKCQRCHGPGGKGDGPDADPDQQKDMDLTSAEHAARNPDGVIFYKVWNGRKKPKMPVFKEELTKEQVWALVSYVQTLRQKS